ncbi:MAG TPA: hypothetical protein VFU21_03715 [Kofleriaceae bacterium]|nr:hypothetical protein [Kofleriaceae bacterium]
MKLIAALAVVLALALPAAAQPAAKAARKPKPKAAATQPAAKKKPVFFDFTGDNIDGDRIRPDGTTIFGLRAARHGSLIRLRGDFIREIVKTGERL